MNRILIFGELGESLGPSSLLVELRAHGVELVSASTRANAEAALEGPQAFDAVIASLADFRRAGALASKGPRRLAVGQKSELDDLLAALGGEIDDCLLKPVAVPELLLALARPRPARRGSRLVADEIVGIEGGLESAWKTLQKAAGFQADVLITGESGTGKELFARSIHRLSKRSEGPFVAINCAAIPEALLESQLFGHVRGAFTDANADHDGVFARADGGTLFLDEVGDFPPQMQVKLLRALQSGEIQRVGAAESIRVDVRVVSATSRDLSAMIKAGSFRDDLYYRLAVIPILVPPLRDRGQDLEALIDHFLARFASKHGLPEIRLSAEAREQLLAAEWPGNVRQLQNALERLVVLAEGPLIPAQLVDAEIRQSDRLAQREAQGVALRGRPLKEAMRSVEAELIAEALAECAGKRAKCAELLSISQRALLYKIKEHDL